MEDNEIIAAWEKWFNGQGDVINKTRVKYATQMAFFAGVKAAQQSVQADAACARIGGCLKVNLNDPEASCLCDPRR